MAQSPATGPCEHNVIGAICWLCSEPQVLCEWEVESEHESRRFMSDGSFWVKLTGAGHEWVEVSMLWPPEEWGRALLEHLHVRPKVEYPEPVLPHSNS